MLRTRQLVATKVMASLIMGVASGNTVDSDWLVTRIKKPVKIEERFAGKEIVLSNALISRTFRLRPNAATVAYDNLMTGQSVIRGIKPEAIVELDGHKYESFRTYELIFDSTQRERKGLSLRRMYRTIAPWSTENPIIMHVRRADPKSVRLAIDQCAEVGFEMVIMTFGSGFNMENIKADYVTQMKELVDYAHSKNIELGGYSLLASRRISDEHDAINPQTGKPGGAIFGNSPCLCSRWGVDYFENITTFIAQTGLDLLEHDGSYPGDVCASRSHPGHHGLGDSQWKQWKKISDFYKWCRARGVYLNVPDWYFLSGSNKSAMGYREVKRQLKLPLYYTGLTKTARIREQREKNKKYRLDREYNVEIPIGIAPGGVTWFVIE